MKSITDLNTFVSVVREGTLSAAAERLGLSTASISKRISRLEAEVGVRLLNRSSRAMGLTEEGRILYHRLLAILDDLDEATASVSKFSKSTRGNLKIAAAISFGRQKIVPLVAEFSRIFADVTIQLHLTDDHVDFIRDGFDVAIVIGQPMDSSLVAKCLLPNRCILCAAPDYLKGRPKISKPSDLRDHECLVLDCYRSFKDTWLLDMGCERDVIRVSGSLITNNSEALREWVLGGNGIALKSEWDIKDELARGRLVQLLPEYKAPNLDFYIVYAGRKNLPARTRSFVDFIESKIHGQVGRTLRDVVDA